MQNNFQIGPVLFDKKVLAISPFSDAAATKVLLGIKFFEHLKNIPVKLFFNQSIGLVGEVICRKLLKDVLTDDDAKDAG